MNRFSIVAKKNEKSALAEQKIKDALIQHHFIYDKENPQIVISIGGDGTLLYAVQKYLNQLNKIYFVAVHTGTLGFFTDYTEDEIEQCVNDIVKNEIYEVFESRMLEISINGNQEDVVYALNEARIENVLKTQTIDIYIDDEFFETVKGNGMCLSTQAGSTAYNRALKGAVVDSGLSVLQLVEIAGIHNNKHNSLGVPYLMKEDRKVTFVCDEFSKAYLCHDHLNREIDDVKTITCILSDKKVRFARFRKYSYLKRLRNLY